MCRVEVLGLGVGTGNGTRLVVEKEPPQQASNAEPERAAYTSLLLRAGVYALSFLSVATGSVIYYQGKCLCHVGNTATPPTASEERF